MSEEIVNRESFSSHDKSFMNSRLREEANEQTVILRDIDKILIKELGFDIPINKIKGITFEDIGYAIVRLYSDKSDKEYKAGRMYDKEYGVRYIIDCEIYDDSQVNEISYCHNVESYVNSLDIIGDLAEMYDELTYYDYTFREFFYYLLDLNSVMYYWLEDVNIQNSIRGIIDIMESDEDEGF